MPSGVSSTIPKRNQVPSTTGTRPNKGIVRQMGAVANWMGGLDEAGQPLQPTSNANSSNSFGDLLESLIVT